MVSLTWKTSNCPTRIDFSLPRFSQSSQSLRDASHPYRNIYLCRLVLRFLAFLSGTLTKYLLNARFQNSDYVFRQLKPGIIFVRHAAKKGTEPRKSRWPKIYNFLLGRLAMSPKLRIIKSEKRWQRKKSATKVKSTMYSHFLPGNVGTQIQKRAFVWWHRTI